MLPVSGVVLAVREPTGEDELFVVETALAPLPALLELARRVGTTVAGGPLDWASLPATDLDAAALVIRRSWIGDAIRTDATCPGPGCRERIDVSFGIGDYIEHHRPRRPRGVTEAPDGAGSRWRGRPSASASRRSPISSRRRPVTGRRRRSPAVASRLPRYRGRSPGAWTARCPPSRRASTISSAGAVPPAGTR